MNIITFAEVLNKSGYGQLSIRRAAMLWEAYDTGAVTVHDIADKLSLTKRQITHALRDMKKQNLLTTEGVELVEINGRSSLGKKYESVISVNVYVISPELLKLLHEHEDSF